MKLYTKCETLWFQVYMHTHRELQAYAGSFIVTTIFDYVVPIWQFPCSLRKYNIVTPGSRGFRGA